MEIYISRGVADLINQSINIPYHEVTVTPNRDTAFLIAMIEEGRLLAGEMPIVKLSVWEKV